MDIRNMVYRTKTYLAGDWTGDSNAIQTLKNWNNNEHLALDFVDVHDLTSSSDSSLKCSIKRSLYERMRITKTFVLVVGDKTDSLRSGACSTCSAYNSYWGSCSRGHVVDHKSYVQYECALAKSAGIKIVVLYNSTKVDRNKCPESLRDIGTHTPMVTYGRDWNGNPKLVWDYPNIKKAIMG